MSFAASNWADVILNFFAIDTGVSPFTTTYVFLFASAFGAGSAVDLTGIAFRSSFTTGFGASSFVFDVSALETFGAAVFCAVGFAVETVGTTPWRLLIVLNAMIPATATTCSTSTMSKARDNFMFGSDISS